MEIRFRAPAKLLNAAAGFLAGYTHSLNPYAGCAFGCSYCYVRRMPVGLFSGRPWGEWVDVKRLEGEAFAKEWKRAHGKGPLAVFIGSATDPYQPVEASYGVTRAVLETMAELPPEFVLLQTRSPLVARDTDVLLRLGDRVRVSMTIETDLEPVRRRFTPQAPPIAARRRALRELQAAGIPVQIAVAPLLPHSEHFAAGLVEAAKRIVVDDFFHGDGAGGRRTEALNIRRLFEGMDAAGHYAPETAKSFFDEMRALAAGRECVVLWSREGFQP